jgi:hypothetical protein
MSFLLNHNYRFGIKKLNAAPTDPKLLIAKGITSVDPDNNEESEETYYFDGGGAAEIDITGFMMSYGFEGHRNYGDPAQDYIMSLANKTGPDRKCWFEVIEPNGDKWEGPATISEIKLPGGDANAKGEISFTISFDGQPTFVENPGGDDFPPLNAPSGLSISEITVASAKVSWGFTPPDTTKEIQFDVFLDGAEISSNTTSKFFELTSLTAATEYTVEVRAQYTENTAVVSSKSQQVKFTTLV